MNCFAHPDTPAVGVCHACGRGVCGKCADPESPALACRDRCEAEVRRLLNLRDFWYAQPHDTIRRRKRHRADSLKGAIVALVIGGVLIGLTFVFHHVAFAGIGFLPFSIGLWELVRRRETTHPDQFRLCPACGFNTTGNTTGRCPECGTHL